MIENKFFKIRLFLLLILFFNLTTFMPTAFAVELTASSYEINLIQDYSKEIISERILIQAETNIDLEDVSENIYLERFNLINEKGEEINPAYIIIETPFIEESLDRQHRFLVKKSDQDEGWFRIKISSEAVYSEPGIYAADIFVENLDWEVSLTLNIRPFVSFEISDNEIQIEIGDPSKFPLYISQKKYNLEFNYNHSDWRLEAYLEDGGLINENENFLRAEKVLYILENRDSDINLDSLNYEDFDSFSDEENITIISGEEYQSGLTSIRFAIRIGDSWSDQPAGIYKGTIIFTLINESQNYLQ